MNITSTSLIVFTVFMQIAAGLVLASELARLRVSVEERKLFSSCLPLALLFTLIGMAASTTHLASPLGAVFVLNNIFSSALSVEIFCVLLFTVTLLFSCYRRYKKPLSATLSGLVTAVAGLFLIWSIANVYMKETMPTFHTPGTLMVFLGTGFLVGAVLGSFMYAVSLRIHKRYSDSSTRVAAVFLFFAILGIALSCFGTPFITIAQEIQDNFGVSGLDAIAGSGQYRAMNLARTGLPLVGFLVLTIAWFRKVQQRLNTFIGYSFIAFIFVLTGELCGRYLFYETYLRLGI